jgi:hypothetical protein
MANPGALIICLQLRQILDVVFLSESDWSRVLRIMPNKMLKNHPFKPHRTIGSILGDAAQPTGMCCSIIQ